VVRLIPFDFLSFVFWVEGFCDMVRLFLLNFCAEYKTSLCHSFYEIGCTPAFHRLGQ
jgi:hypothetical protein